MNPQALIDRCEQQATQPDNFERFILASRHWLKEFGLDEWEVMISAEALGQEGPQARAHIYSMDRAADFVWNSDNGEVINGPFTPERIALHEVLHILLAGMQEPKGKASDWQYAAEHAVINRLVRVIEKQGGAA